MLPSGGDGRRPQALDCFYTWPSWFWEFNKLPFSLVNSPPKFQRIIEDCLGSFNMTICIVHLDDLISAFLLKPLKSTAAYSVIDVNNDIYSCFLLI